MYREQLTVSLIMVQKEFITKRMYAYQSNVE